MGFTIVCFVCGTRQLKAYYFSLLRTLLRTINIVFRSDRFVGRLMVFEVFEGIGVARQS